MMSRKSSVTTPLPQIRPGTAHGKIQRRDSESGRRKSLTAGRHQSLSNIRKVAAGLGGPGSSLRGTDKQIKKKLSLQYQIPDCTTDGKVVLAPKLSEAIITTSEFIPLEVLMEKRALDVDDRNRVFINEDQAVWLYEARCADNGLEVTPQRYLKFRDLLLSQCSGSLWKLHGCGLKTESAKAIASILSDNVNYSILDLSGNSLHDAGAVHIASLIEASPHLVHISLRSNNITHVGAAAICEALLTNVTVTSLDMSGVVGFSRNLLGKEGARSVSKMLEGNAVLHTLDLSCTAIGSKGVAQLVTGLKKNSTLRELSLSENCLMADSCKVLSNSVGAVGICDLHNFSIANNKIGDTGIANLTCFLQSLRNLSHIDLSNIGITNIGLCKLADIMEEYSPIETLKLDGNNVCIELVDGIEKRSLTDGLCSLKNVLQRKGSRLRSLSLRNCRIQDFAASVLSSILSQCRLTNLNISQNEICSTGMKTVLSQLSGNSTLTSLDCSDTQLGVEGEIFLANALAVNRTLQHLRCVTNGALHSHAEFAKALSRNETLLSIDSKAPEYQAALKRNRDIWKQSRTERYRDQILEMENNARDLTHQLLSIKNSQGEADRQESEHRNVKSGHEAFLRELRLEEEMLEDQLRNTSSVIQAQRDFVEEGNAQLAAAAKQCDRQKAKCTLRLQTEAQIVKSIEAESEVVGVQIQSLQEKLALLKGRNNQQICIAEEKRLKQQQAAEKLAETLVELTFELKRANLKRQMSLKSTSSIRKTAGTKAK